MVTIKIDERTLTVPAGLTVLEAAEQAGMQGHIAKPIDLQKMMETIRTVIQRKG